MLYTMLMWGLFIIAKLATICCEVWMSATEADMIGRLLVPTIALPHVCSVSGKNTAACKCFFARTAFSLRGP